LLLVYGILLMLWGTLELVEDSLQPAATAPILRTSYSSDRVGHAELIGVPTMPVEGLSPEAS